MSAARELLKNGHDVVVLEARDRVGGRTFTPKSPETGYMDYGGSYVGATQNHLLRTLQELDLAKNLYSVYIRGKFVYLSNGKRFTYGAEDLPKSWNPLVQLDMNNFIRKVDKMGEEIPADSPWDAPHGEQWDKMTYKEFINETCWTIETREFAAFLLQIIVTAEPYESSLLWFLWYIKQCGGVKRILAVKSGGQEMKLAGGMQQLSEKIADILGDRLKLESAVVSLEHSSSGVVVKCLSGDVYRGTHVILAMAPPMQMKIHYSPSLGPLRNQIMQRMPMGSVWKLEVFYRTPFWRDLGYAGAVQATQSEKYAPVVYTIDDTKPDGTYPAIIGFMPADRARTLLKLTKEQRLEMVKETYRRAFRSDKANDVVHYVEHNWMGEEYSGGCYTSMLPPGVLTTFRSVVRDPIGRVYFAGTETATEWSGYINGAIEAGERAAKEVLVDIGKISKEVLKQKEPVNHLIEIDDLSATFSEKYLPSVPCFLKMIALVGVTGAALCMSKKCPNFQNNLCKMIAPQQLSKVVE